jgi:hypothetical protein
MGVVVSKYYAAYAKLAYSAADTVNLAAYFTAR